MYPALNVVGYWPNSWWGVSQSVCWRHDNVCIIAVDDILAKQFLISGWSVYAYQIIIFKGTFLLHVCLEKCWTFIKICFELWLHKFVIILLVPGTLVYISASDKVKSSILYLEGPYFAFLLHGAHVFADFMHQHRSFETE